MNNAFLLKLFITSVLCLACGIGASAANSEPSTQEIQERMKDVLKEAFSKQKFRDSLENCDIVGRPDEGRHSFVGRKVLLSVCVHRWEQKNGHPWTKLPSREFHSAVRFTIEKGDGSLIGFQDAPSSSRSNSVDVSGNANDVALAWLIASKPGKVSVKATLAPSGSRAEFIDAASTVTLETSFRLIAGEGGLQEKVRHAKLGVIDNQEARSKRSYVLENHVASPADIKKSRLKAVGKQVVSRSGGKTKVKAKARIGDQWEDDDTNSIVGVERNFLMEKEKARKAEVEITSVRDREDSLWEVRGGKGRFIIEEFDVKNQPPRLVERTVLTLDEVNGLSRLSEIFLPEIEAAGLRTGETRTTIFGGRGCQEPYRIMTSKIREVTDSEAAALESNF